MRFLFLLAGLSYCLTTFSQNSPNIDVPKIFKVGYSNLITVDSGRIYKKNTSIDNKLHLRPIEIDFWYPTLEQKGTAPLPYNYFLNLLQLRSNSFQDDTVYNHMTTELVEYLCVNLSIGDTSGLTHLATNSLLNAIPLQQKFPLIIYLCSFNGMCYENLGLFEFLAAHGYTVACITSVGRYPGNMTTQIPDLIEQVNDGNFAIHYLEKEQQIDNTKIGVIGYSWGGPAAMMLAMNNKEVKSFLSLDGSELHYYGASREEDNDFNQIIHTPNFRARKLNIPYAYLESGFKQSDQDADSILDISNFTRDSLLYIHFPNATHEDFSFLTTLGLKGYGINNSRSNLNVPYQKIALCFFNENLKESKNELSPFLDSLFRNRIADTRYPIAKIKKDLILIKGKIVDEKNGESLAFVNVGIQNKNTGTVATQDGDFQLKIDPKLKHDSITFSMAGYRTRVIGIPDLLRSSKSSVIALKEKTSELKEVIISTKALKTEIRGNKTTSRFISIGLPLRFLGSETGIKLHLGSKPVLLESFSFNISDNRLDTAVFRLNIYNMHNGVPVENILHHNILIPVGKRTGRYTFDLKKYMVVLSSDVLLSLEWIEGSSNGLGNGAIFLSAGFLNSATWHRLTSQAEWKKATGLGVGFNVLVQEIKN